MKTLLILAALAVHAGLGVLSWPWLVVLVTVEATGFILCWKLVPECPPTGWHSSTPASERKRFD